MVDEAGKEPRHHLVHDELQVAHHYQQTLILKPKLIIIAKQSTCITLNLHY